MFRKLAPIAFVALALTTAGAAQAQKLGRRQA